MVQPNNIRKQILQMAIAAVLGAALSYTAVKLLLHGHAHIAKLTWSQAVSLWLGVSYAGMGLGVFALTLNRKALARRLEGPSAEFPATDEEVSSYRWQSLCLVLAGTLILVPGLGADALRQHAASSSLAMGSLTVLLAVQTLINIRIWRRGDEFVRRVVLEASAFTFGIFQLLLFLWAAAERLGLAHPLASWDAMMLLMALYLITGLSLGFRYRAEMVG